MRAIISSLNLDDDHLAGLRPKGTYFFPVIESPKSPKSPKSPDGESIVSADKEDRDFSRRRYSKSSVEVPLTCCSVSKETDRDVFRTRELERIASPSGLRNLGPKW